MTVTSARIPDEDTRHRASNLCVFSRIQKGTPGLIHKECVLQRVSMGALSDVTVVLRMRQSIALIGPILTPFTVLSCISYKTLTHILVGPLDTDTIVLTWITQAFINI